MIPQVLKMSFIFSCNYHIFIAVFTGYVCRTFTLFVICVNISHYVIISAAQTYGANTFCIKNVHLNIAPKSENCHFY